MATNVSSNPFALLEAPRAIAEMGSIPLSLPILANTQPGDGHGVFVIPGFGASDRSTFLLRRFLEYKGYQVSGWGMGRNLGMDRSGGIDRLMDKFTAFQRKTGAKVSLIGWSLGGVHARRIARLKKSGVRQVICLGSPINDLPADTRVWQVYERVNGQVLDDQAIRNITRHYYAPIEVPSTSIYSKSDGVVPWQFSLERSAARRDNIEVVASHIGLGVNPSVLYIIADRLAQPEGQWQAFEDGKWSNRLALTLLNPLGALWKTLGSSLPA